VRPHKVPLIQSPTPLHRLDRLADQLGLDLWIKRDDLTGFAMGGNKGRKLEYLMAEALGLEAQVIVSCGALQSNFVRQLGAACSRFGLKCAAAVMSLPYEGTVGKPEEGHLTDQGGNALLDRILGVDLRIYPDGTWEDLFAHMEALARQYEEEGAKVYRVPVGGSSPLGAFAFAEAAREIQEQAPPFGAIVCASSSGSTQSGLVYGFRDTATRVIGISCDPEPDLPVEFAALCDGLDDLLGENKKIRPDDFEFHTEWVGAGYGIPSPECLEAIRLLAQTEAIFLDPVYSGKAFAGLLGLAQRGELPDRVLFWHTGGVPALFAADSFFR
jgi:D-cysteine desulfhydrase family pyridoxal phosphate-dependent enzyme